MTYEIGALAFIVFAFLTRIIAVLRLKNKHPLIWEKLGQPSVLFKGTHDPASMAMTKFFFKGSFLDINDNMLQIECVLFNLSAIIGTGFMVASFVT